MKEIQLYTNSHSVSEAAVSHSVGNEVVITGVGVDVLRIKGDSSSSFHTSGIKSMPEKESRKEERKSLKEPQRPCSSHGTHVRMIAE